MKKLIVIGIVMVMVLSATAAMATVDNQWTILMKAGQLSGYSGTGAVPTGTLTWLNTFLTATMQLAPTGTAGTTNSSSDFQATQSGITYGPAGTKRVLTSKKIFDSLVTTYTWDMILETGGSYAGNPVSLAFWVPTAAEDFTGWTIKAYKQELVEGNLVYVEKATLANPTVYNGSGNSSSAQVIAYQTNLGTSVNQNWRFVAMSEVPEPGSMVALFSGLVGLVGFGIRRRK